MESLKELKSIIAGAPEGASHIDVDGDYVKFIDDEMYYYSFVSGYVWSGDYVSPCELRSLSDIEQIIEQREMIELAWQAIGEAGYEDHCNELRDYMDSL